MALKVLLDTNVYSAMSRRDAAVEESIRESEAVFMSIIVVGELLQGFRSGNRYRANLRSLEEFLAMPQVELVSVTRETADRFGLVAAELRRIGKPIPSNDIWIAAQCMHVGATLLTRDRHFAVIRGLDALTP